MWIASRPSFLRQAVWIERAEVAIRQHDCDPRLVLAAAIWADAPHLEGERDLVAKLDAAAAEPLLRGERGGGDRGAWRDWLDRTLEITDDTGDLVPVPLFDEAAVGINGNQAEF